MDKSEMIFTARLVKISYIVCELCGRWNFESIRAKRIYDTGSIIFCFCFLFLFFYHVVIIFILSVFFSCKKSVLFSFIFASKWITQFCFLSFFHKHIYNSSFLHTFYFLKNVQNLCTISLYACNQFAPFCVFV